MGWFNKTERKIDDEFRKYLRVVTNILDNTQNSKERRELLYSLASCDDVYKYDSWKFPKDKEELSKQLQEEKGKIDLINQKNVTESCILEAENFSISYGSIPFLIYEDHSGLVSKDKFCKRRSIYHKYFDVVKVDNSEQLDTDNLKVMVKAFVRSTSYLKDLEDLTFFDTNIGPFCGWRSILRSALGIKFFGKIINEDFEEEYHTYVDKFIKNQIIDDDVMDLCFQDNSRLRWIHAGYPALYSRGGYTYSALILDNCNQGFMPKTVLKEAFELLKASKYKVEMLFNDYNYNLRDKEKYDLQTQIDLYRGFMIYFRCSSENSENFAIVIPWAFNEGFITHDQTKSPFLIKGYDLENEVHKDFYKSNEYDNEVSFIIDEEPKNLENYVWEKGKKAEAEDLVNIKISAMASGLVKIIKNYCK